jgi:small subunit ribosomal protein S8
MIESIVSILVDKGYLESYSVKEDGNIKKIKVVLKYDDSGRSVINEVKKISKPGRRIYKGRDEIKSFKNGYGTLIVSTSAGVLPNDEAFKRGIGGEVICSIW